MATQSNAFDWLLLMRNWYAPILNLRCANVLLRRQQVLRSSNPVQFDASSWTANDALSIDYWAVDMRLQDMSESTLTARWDDERRWMNEASSVLRDPKANKSAKRAARDKYNHAFQRRQRIAKQLKKKGVDIEANPPASNSTEASAVNKSIIPTMPALLPLSSASQANVGGGAAAAAAALPVGCHLSGFSDEEIHANSQNTHNAWPSGSVALLWRALMLNERNSVAKQ